jgi:hypothetical protein
LPSSSIDFLFRFLSRKNERKELLNRTVLADQKSNLTRAPKQETTNILEPNLPSLDFLASHSFSDGWLLRTPYLFSIEFVSSSKALGYGCRFNFHWNP